LIERTSFKTDEFLNYVLQDMEQA